MTPSLRNTWPKNLSIFLDILFRTGKQKSLWLRPFSDILCHTWPFFNIHSIAYRVLTLANQAHPFFCVEGHG